MKPSELLKAAAHRPWPLPMQPWSVSMRWSDLLFAHWPIDPANLVPLIPSGLQLDTFEGVAWAGVIPFRMEQVRLRGLPTMRSFEHFPEANLRTYVTDPVTRSAGVYFFALETTHPLAVALARLWYHLPYFFASMRIVRHSDGWIEYCSRRRFARTRRAQLALRYRPVPAAVPLPPSQPGTLEYFLTERYALFTSVGRGILRAPIHHLPWELVPAEAEFSQETLAAAHGIALPHGQQPLLHCSRSLDVLAWTPRCVSGDVLREPVPLLP